MKNIEIIDILQTPQEFGDGDAIVIIAEGNTLETFLEKIKSSELYGIYGEEEWFKEQTKDLETFKGYTTKDYVYYNPKAEQLEIGYGEIKVFIFDL